MTTIAQAREKIKIKRIKVYYGWVEVVDEFCPELLAQYLTAGWFPACSQHAAQEEIHLIHSRVPYRVA